ncbi:MAG: hypothetical protein V1913_10270 [Fibrobacterota bacterium]
MATPESISKGLQIQWQDTLHIRDQTWKIPNYSIVFILGVVGLNKADLVTEFGLTLAYIALVLTTFIGLIIAIHHRRCQKVKLQIIEVYERELGLYPLIEHLIARPKNAFLRGFSTSTFIVIMQLSLFVISLLMFLKFKCFL